MRARELGIVGGALALLCAVVYGPHVADGGFYWDDWQWASRVRYPPLASPDFSGPIDLGLLAYRPVLALLIPGVHVVLGPDPTLHILLGLGLNLVTALCFYALARELRVPALAAGLMAALSLIFPWADSMRLWPTAALNYVGVILYLLGTIVSLRGVRAPTRRRRALLGALGVLLVGLGVLTYEVAAVVALLSVFLYAREVPRRAAVRRWTIDVVVVAAAAGFVALNTPRSMEPLPELVDHGFEILGDSVELLARAVVPVDAVPTELALLGVAALLAAALAARRRLEPGDPARVALGGWLVVAGASAVGILAAYALLVPADSHYLPLAPGVNNRINLLAALPYSAFVVALAMLAGTLARAPTLLGAALCALVALGWLDRTLDDRADWIRSAERQEVVLAAIERGVPGDRPRGSTLYTFGEPHYVGPGIPIFSVSWDLKGAARLRLDDRTVRAYAIDTAGFVACRAGRVEPLGYAYEPIDSAAYGKAFFVDVRTSRAVRIDSLADCERERARFSPVYR